jgi:osmotically-inducible protein OsmY
MITPEPFQLSRVHAADRDIEVAVRKIATAITRGENVDVFVTDGEVTLSGFLSERWMQLEVEHAALHVRGVRSVVSRIRGQTLKRKCITSPSRTV